MPQYRVIVKQPMDLGTVWDNLERGKYFSAAYLLGADSDESAVSFAEQAAFQAMGEDISLCVSNCQLYNAEGSDIHAAAARLRGEWEKLEAKWLDVSNPPSRSLLRSAAVRIADSEGFPVEWRSRMRRKYSEGTTHLLAGATPPAGGASSSGEDTSGDAALAASLQAEAEAEMQSRKRSTRSSSKETTTAANEEQEAGGDDDDDDDDSGEKGTRKRKRGDDGDEGEEGEGDDASAAPKSKKMKKEEGAGKGKGKSSIIDNISDYLLMEFATTIDPLAGKANWRERKRLRDERKAMKKGGGGGVGSADGADFSAPSSSEKKKKKNASSSSSSSSVSSSGSGSARTRTPKGRNTLQMAQREVVKMRSVYSLWLRLSASGI